MNLSPRLGLTKRKSGRTILEMFIAIAYVTLAGFLALSAITQRINGAGTEDPVSCTRRVIDAANLRTYQSIEPVFMVIKTVSAVDAGFVFTSTDGVLYRAADTCIGLDVLHPGRSVFVREHNGAVVLIEPHFRQP